MGAAAPPPSRRRLRMTPPASPPVGSGTPRPEVPSVLRRADVGIEQLGVRDQGAPRKVTHLARHLRHTRDGRTRARRHWTRHQGSCHAPQLLGVVSSVRGVGPFLWHHSRGGVVRGAGPLPSRSDGFPPAAQRG
jgi:hypothetical protein